MNTSDSSVKKCCSPEFTDLFRWILYHNKLTNGAKLLAFAILDTPLSKDPKNKVLVYKLHTSRQMVSIWRQELISNKMVFRHDKIQA